MMGSSFNRLLHGRRRRGKGGDRAMRDTVLAGCVAVLFFSLQSPEIVDRWLWLPFILALCFRDSGPRASPGSRSPFPSQSRSRAVPATAIRIRIGTLAARDGRAAPRPAPCQRDRPDRDPDQEVVMTTPGQTRTATPSSLGLGEMFDDRILGLDSAHVFMVSAQAVAARSRVVAEVGCGRGVLVDPDQPGGAWQDLRGDGRTVIGIDIEHTGEREPGHRRVPPDRRGRAVAARTTARWTWPSAISSWST